MSGGIEDVFGEAPGRPDHPDFWRLSEIILQLDSAIAEGAASVIGEISSEVDLKSATYMADQHGRRCVEILGIKGDAKTLLETMFVANWYQAFIMGSRFQKRGGKQ